MWSRDAQSTISFMFLWPIYLLFLSWKSRMPFWDNRALVFTSYPYTHISLSVLTHFSSFFSSYDDIFSNFGMNFTVVDFISKTFEKFVWLDPIDKSSLASYYSDCDSIWIPWSSFRTVDPSKTYVLLDRYKPQALKWDTSTSIFFFFLLFTKKFYFKSTWLTIHLLYIYIFFYFYYFYLFYKLPIT